jgi:hypothetical protein
LPGRHSKESIMSSFHPIVAVVRVCLSSANGAYAQIMADKASRLRSALVGRSIFGSAELQSSAPWPAAEGTLIVLGEASEVVRALQEGRNEAPVLITMFEECGTLCVLERGDTRRVGLIIPRSETADALATRQASRRLTELRARLARGGEEWASTYYNSLSDGDHEETTESVLRGFPPGREQKWQMELQTEVAILRFLLDVAELSWLDQAANAAQAGVLAFRAQAENHVGGRDASADRAAIVALDYQMHLKQRLRSEGATWLAPFKQAAADAVSAHERATVAGVESTLQHLLHREEQCLECRGILALGGPGAAEAAAFAVPPLVSMHTGSAGHARYLLARALLQACLRS